jgi:D-glycero-alpha-D-manno-heptose-7-phosphate kinase
MIMSSTPFRMSFFGGGTDYPAWYREHGGSVLAAAIDKYCHISCRYLPPFFEYKSRILYSKVECVNDNAKIEHPAVRAILGYLDVKEGVEIHHDGDLPARTGLGTSSAFAVGMLNTVYALKNRMVPHMQLAKEAIHIEQDILKENVGCQDQVITATGGLSRVDFSPDDNIRTTPIILPPKRLSDFQDHILLYFTGFSRIASEVVKEQLRRMPDNKPEMLRMREMVGEAVNILTGEGSLGEFGRLLDEGWQLKRRLSPKVSSEAIDDIYEAARSAGALGGKLLGAGGGGFMILFARPSEQPRIKEKLHRLLRIPFRFENQGSRITLYEPQAEGAEQNGAQDRSRP